MFGVYVKDRATIKWSVEDIVNTIDRGLWLWGARLTELIVDCRCIDVKQDSGGGWKGQEVYFGQRLDSLGREKKLGREVQSYFFFFFFLNHILFLEDTFEQSLGIF